MFNTKEKGPTFLGIGAQKAATTWLHSTLAQSHNVYVPPVKELHYFDRIDRDIYPSGLGKQDRKGAASEGQTGLTAYKKSNGRIRRNVQRVADHIVKGEISSVHFYYKFLLKSRSDDWYANLYPSAKPVRGEITPEYALLSDQMIQRVTGRFPNLKVIYMIRNPIERAWSGYRYTLTRKALSDTDIEGGLAFLDKEAASYHWRYHENAQRWHRHLAKGHLFIGFYDAVSEQPNALISDIESFLGCAIAAPDLEKRNASLSSDMPEAFRRKAETIFAEEMTRLSSELGGYCSEWISGKAEPSGTRPASHVL